MRTLRRRPDLHAGLEGGNGPASIATYIDARGAAMVTNDKITRIGATPEESELRAIASWLDTNEDLITATDRLAEVYPPAATLNQTAAGLLAVRVSRRRPEFVMWFRPEQAQTVSWAGNPQKPVEIGIHDGEVRLMPRTSFAIWQESVAGPSRPWADF